MPSSYDTVKTNALAAVLAQPNFAGVATGAVRARLFCSTGHGDVLPFVCVAGGKEREREAYFGGRVWMEYPVFVGIFTEKGPAVQDAAALALIDSRREEARDALWQVGVVHASQVDADYDPEPAYDLGGLDQLFAISLQRFDFIVDEAR